MSHPSRLFAENFLKKVREFVALGRLNALRLPGWVKSANVCIAKLNNSNLFLLEDSASGNDSFVDCGNVWSDLQFILGLPAYIPQSASLKAPIGENSKLIILVGEYGEKERVVLI